jgi:hypothetical protein
MVPTCVSLKAFAAAMGQELKPGALYTFGDRPTLTTTFDERGRIEPANRPSVRHHRLRRPWWTRD